MALLYIGCRDPDTDALYRDELKAWAQVGAVDVRWAFSRRESSSSSSPPETTGGRRGQYVQERFWGDREEVRGLLEERNGLVFVRGSRQVADGVEDVMKQIRKEWVSLESDESDDDEAESAEEWFAKLKGERYMADVFD